MEHKQVSRREFNAMFSAAVASAACATGGTALAASRGWTGQHADCAGRAIGYLESHGQADDGSFAAQAGVGVTGTVAAFRIARIAHNIAEIAQLAFRAVANS